MRRSPEKWNCFSGGTAHEIHAKTFAGNAAIVDPEHGETPRKICQATGPGLYPPPDAELWNGHTIAADDEWKQHRKRLDGTVLKQWKNDVFLSVCPAEAETAAYSTGDAVSPVHSPAASGENLLWLFLFRRRALRLILLSFFPAAIIDCSTGAFFFLALPFSEANLMALPS